MSAGICGDPNHPTGLNGKPFFTLYTSKIAIV